MSNKIPHSKNAVPSPHTLAQLQAMAPASLSKPNIEELERKQPKLKRQIHPRFDLVLVERLPKYETILVMPDSVEDDSQYFKVVEVGPGRVNERGHLMKSNLEVGDIVFAMLQGAGLFHQPNGTKVWLVQDQNIIAKFSKVGTDCISEIFEKQVTQPESPVTVDSESKS